MSLTWLQRKKALNTLLQSQGDEDEDGLALDRLLHGQQVIGKTARTVEIDALRFQDKDLTLIGKLDQGQFGVIDLVMCLLDRRVYVRKTIEKRLALRARDQCSPQIERDILLQARKTRSLWAPHLLCAFQMPTQLKLIMDYAEGGSLWDALESSPDGRILERDLLWWTPQTVAAINWCHSQGFVHRDIKPQNFVITAHTRLLLVDFGSAAALLPSQPDGLRVLPKRACLVPCGTCDYISPEILRAYEDALVALEMDEHDSNALDGEEGYGLETDWWSLGAMLYEMAYGVAPFFANDIRQTYMKIMNHQNSLTFPRTVSVSSQLQDLLARLLTDAEVRIGRRSPEEVTNHCFFDQTDWSNLHGGSPPHDLHLPQFTYAGTLPATCPPNDVQTGPDESHSQPFNFSTLFQSSYNSSPGLSILRSTPLQVGQATNAVSSFIGFSWGPPSDAFPAVVPSETVESRFDMVNVITPQPSRLASMQGTLTPFATPFNGFSTPGIYSHGITTPLRPANTTPFRTLPRTSTTRRSAVRRAVSDWEAMKQLVDCVGISAQKKVLESGRKPRILMSFSRSIGSKKELRFVSVSVQDSPTGGVTGIPPSASSGSEETESEGPPSPSPSHRPGSAMSFLSRRSATPTFTGTFSQRLTSGTASRNGSSLLQSRARSNSVNMPLYRDESSRRLLTLDDVILSEMDSKHASLMASIAAIEKRLGRLRSAG